MLPNTSPDLDRDELAKFARPSKRVHLETPEDRHTYGKLAGLYIDPTSMAGSVLNESAFGRPQSSRSNSGVAGAFGLSAFGANGNGLASAPRVPPSSPTKTDAVSSSFGESASTIYQQAVAPAPPTSPRAVDSSFAPSSSPLHLHSFDASTLPTKRQCSADLEDSDMRQRRGVPSSYEVEPDRIVVTSLDDTSSSEGDAASELEGQKTPDADTSTESKDSSNDFVINNELMEKLEAHSRAVLTGTSDRDNAASTSRSGGASSTASRSRRSGRRSAGSAVSSLGSLLSSRRRSAQSSPGSSGYASPITAEDARGALILWKDPEEVLKSTSASASTPLKQSELASVPEDGFMNQLPVSFQSGSSVPQQQPNPSNSFAGFSGIPGMASLSPPSQAPESPLYAQQSSLSSSYFPEPSLLETHFEHRPQAFGAAPARQAMGSRLHHNTLAFGQAYQQQLPLHRDGPHYRSQPHATTAAFDAHTRTHGYASGAQPIDLSGCFGPAEEMDLDG